MFNRAYGLILRHAGSRRGYWGRWYYRGRYEKVLARLLKHCPNEEKFVLDLGCGLGLYAQYLYEMGSKCYYLGCDIDTEALRSAYHGNNVEYLLCDIDALPFVPRCADLVLCSEVLEHLNTPYHALEKICDIVDETLIITFPEEKALSLLGDRHPEHISTIDRMAIIHLLKSRRFEIVEVSHIFSSFVPCGILEFLGVPINALTQSVVIFIDRLLNKILPSLFVPHKTILVVALDYLFSFPQFASKPIDKDNIFSHGPNS